MAFDESLNNVPTTRYQGSKRKILSWIYECIRNYDYHTVLDAFGGSGVVSYLFKKMGKIVTYNDLFRFNAIIGESIIENDRVLLTKEDIDYILTKIGSFQSFISDTFQGVYYTDEENQWLDSTIYNIHSLGCLYEGDILKYKKAIAFNTLFQSCMAKRPYNLFHRKNLDMRIRDVKRSFGNKTTWEKPFEDHFRYFANEINNAVFYSNQRCQVINQDAFSIKTGSYDLVYIDPPYLKKKGEGNESSDYLRCYHFLEGIARYDEWGDIINHSSLNKRIDASYSPNYFKPSDAYSVFEKLIKKFSESIIVFSYRYGGTPTIEELSNIMLKHKDHLDVFYRQYKYALNKQKDDSSDYREVLLIGY